VTQGETAPVYVVEDDEAVRRSLLFLLDVEGLPAQGFASAAAFLSAVPKPSAGCVITDLRMEGLDGADLVRALPEHGIHLPVIVITGHGDAPAAARALAVGAFDFIEKPFLASSILEAVRAALSSATPDAARLERARHTGSRIALLTEGERTVLDLAMQGMTDGTIAVVLSLPHAEIERLRAGIMVRLGAASLLALARLVRDARRYADRDNGSL
jgi:two-component system response regulator FixJ